MNSLLKYRACSSQVPLLPERASQACSHVREGVVEKVSAGIWGGMECSFSSRICLNRSGMSSNNDNQAWSRLMRPFEHLLCDSNVGPMVFYVIKEFVYCMYTPAKHSYKLTIPCKEMWSPLSPSDLSFNLKASVFWASSLDEGTAKANATKTDKGIKTCTNNFIPSLEPWNWHVHHLNSPFIGPIVLWARAP